MRRKVIVSCLLLLLCIFLCGCPYESEFPLAMPGTSQIDRELIGDWKFSEQGTKETGTLSIYPFNDHELIFMSVENDGKIIAYRAYITPIEGETFMSIREIDRSADSKPWHIVHYSVNENQLVLQIVDDTLMKNERIHSSDNLFEFVRKHLKSDKLYGEETEMIFKRCLENQRTSTE